MHLALRERAEAESGVSGAMNPAEFAHRASGGRWICAPHLELLNRSLMDVASGVIKRLMICMPPRHGKSEFTSKYFPAWYLGTFPDRRIILTSYEAEFAKEWGRKVRDILQEHGQSYFGVSVRPDTSAANRWNLTGRAGGMVTSGVGGPITGKGADLLIIDDPVKNAEEADSETYRNRAWEWYTSTAYTRLEPGGALILIQTRWHEDDLAGRILEAMEGGGEQWHVLSLPALSETGEVFAEMIIPAVDAARRGLREGDVIRP